MLRTKRASRVTICSYKLALGATQTVFSQCERFNLRLGDKLADSQNVDGR